MWKVQLVHPGENPQEVSAFVSSAERKLASGTVVLSVAFVPATCSFSLVWNKKQNYPFRTSRFGVCRQNVWNFTFVWNLKAVLNSFQKMTHIYHVSISKWSLAIVSAELLIPQVWIGKLWFKFCVCADPTCILVQTTRITIRGGRWYQCFETRDICNRCLEDGRNNTPSSWINWGQYWHLRKIRHQAGGRVVGAGWEAVAH